VKLHGKLMTTTAIMQDSKYALPTAPATVPQEVDASMVVRRQVAQSVQVSQNGRALEQGQENN